MAGRIKPAARRLAAVVALTLMWAGGEALAIDLHYFWDQRCADCHGHAGKFARTFLSVKDGELAGRHPDRDLRLFLGNHGVPKPEVEAVYAMLLAQATSDDQFAKRCGGCHGSAADFARGALSVEDGALRGRNSGRLVSEFLDGHAKLQAEDVPIFAELLARVEREVHRP